MDMADTSLKPEATIPGEMHAYLHVWMKNVYQWTCDSYDYSIKTCRGFWWAIILCLIRVDVIKSKVPDKTMKSHYNFLTTVYNNFPQKYSQKTTHIFPLKVRYELSFMIMVNQVAIEESFMGSDYDLCPFCAITVLYAILVLSARL